MRSVEDAEVAVLAAAKAMLRKGLVEGTAGNLSARRADGTVVITPSSVDYEDMTLDDLVVVDPEGTVVSCREGRAPSSEKALHLACYRAFDDVGAVIHSHPVHATMFAVTHRAIPACIYEFAIYVGGDVRVAEYAPSGTDDVGNAAVAALKDRGAALLANHGMVAVAATPAKALHVTALVERSAQIVWGASQLGPVQPLPDAINERFAQIYGYLRTN